MYIVVEGFILSEVSYKESSKILNIFTKEYGIIGVFASGVKKIKSPLRSSANQFTYGVFNIKYKEGKLSNLISIDVVDSLKNIRSDLTLISYLSYMADLTNQTYKESSSNYIYNLFISSIKKLEEKLDPEVLTNILEIKYLKFLGVELNFFKCSKCEKENELCKIDFNTGDIICAGCAKNTNVMDDKVLKLLIMYDKVNINSVKDIKIEDKYKKNINQFLKNYYDNYTGLYLYSKNHLEKILNSI